jgi:pilus assembly protein Flp/PilA
MRHRLASSEKGSVMRKLRYLVKSFAREEQGMETVEWAILAALIVAGLVAVITALGSNVLARFTTLKDATS